MNNGRAARAAGMVWVALVLGVLALPALASNEVAALCLFPTLGVGMLVDIASGLFWVLLPFCFVLGVLLGRWGSDISRDAMPYPLLLGLLGLALLYALHIAAAGFDVPDDPKVLLKVGRCVLRAGDVHPAENVLWLPVVVLLGLLIGVVFAAARNLNASPLSTAAPALRNAADVAVTPSKAAAPATTGTAPVLPATSTPPSLTLGLRDLSRIPTQPVDAETRARIAAAAARQSGAAPARPAATPPPLPPRPTPRDTPE